MSAMHKWSRYKKQNLVKHHKSNPPVHEVDLHEFIQKYFYENDGYLGNFRLAVDN